ncbi:MAG: hypothetical protein MZV64_31625 [Ignavibacteriales bacterium]|nr:hypothetical protein [Ignavibacteriales bacterium]
MGNATAELIWQNIAAGEPAGPSARMDERYTPGPGATGFTSWGREGRVSVSYARRRVHDVV